MIYNDDRNPSARSEQSSVDTIDTAISQVSLYIINFPLFTFLYQAVDAAVRDVLLGMGSLIHPIGLDLLFSSLRKELNSLSTSATIITPKLPVAAKYQNRNKENSDDDIMLDVDEMDNGSNDDDSNEDDEDFIDDEDSGGYEERRGQKERQRATSPTGIELIHR